MAINDRTGISSPVDALGYRILDASLAVIFISEITYVFTFNSLVPNDWRLQLAGAMLVAQILVSTWALLVRPALWSVLVAAALAIKLLCWAVSTFTGVASAVDPAEIQRVLLRELVPYAAAISILTFAERLPYRLIFAAILASSALAGALALTGEPVQVLDTVRLSPFTGGEDWLGLHSSAYIVLIAMFIIDGYRRAGWLPTRWSIPIIGFLTAVLAGYQVRTALVMLGVYVVGHAWQSRWRRFVLVGGLIALGCALVYAAGALVVTNFLSGAETWGSGRVGSYQYRLTMLMQRDLAPLLFGTGPASDAIVIPTWWWGALDSHSDVLNALVEAGAVGLLGIAVFMYAFWLRVDRAARPLLLSLLACTAISNGLLARPTEFFLLVVAMAVSEIHRYGLAKHSPTALRRGPTPVYSARSQAPWAPADGRYRS